MPSPAQISRAHTKLAKLSYGMKYHKVDFHLHTPASTDARGKNKYGFNPYAKPLVAAKKLAAAKTWAGADAVAKAQRAILADARALAEDIVAEFVAQDLRMVAITDHNSLGTIWPVAAGKTMDLAAPTWYELLDDVANHRRARGEASVLILPGTEVSTAGVHILGVFAPTEPRREIHLVVSSLLTELGIPVDKFGSNPEIGHASPREAVDRIHAHGGVAIIAHVDARNKALFNLHPLGSSELAAVLGHPRLHAVEMVAPKQLSKVAKGVSGGRSLGQWIADVRRDAGLSGLAYFQGSDAHGLDRIGARWSWLMMSKPSFAGLRDALLSPSSRVRLGELAGALPKRALYVYGFELNHPNFGTVRARLNRNLNCIVGGADSGKSTLLSLLDHAVGGPGPGAGRAMLFVERVEGERRRMFCLSRHADAVVVHEQVGQEFIPVPAKDPVCAQLRPRFYDRAGMDELTNLGAKLDEFMRRYFGKPSEANVATFNRRLDLPEFLNAASSPLLRARLDRRGAYVVEINTKWRRGTSKSKPKFQSFERSTPSRQRLMIMIMVAVSGRSGPLIIDEPGDEFDNADISQFLVPLVKLLKGRGQLILATRNPNLAVNADPENFVVLRREPGAKTKLEAGFAIDDEQRREDLVELLEGDLAAFERRRQLYAPTPESQM